VAEKEGIAGNENPASLPRCRHLEEDGNVSRLDRIGRISRGLLRFSRIFAFDRRAPASWLKSARASF